MRKLRKPPAPRNPMAAELIRNPLYRTRSGKTREERDRQRDQWERGAKHKGRHDPQDHDALIRFKSVR